MARKSISVLKRPKTRTLVPTEDIVKAYQETGSVWAAGKRVGLAGQTIHERLVSVGYPLRGRKWSELEVQELVNLLDAYVPMSEIAKRLGRPFGATAAKASSLGLKVKRRPKVNGIPRGAGYDKQSISRHVASLEKYQGTVTQFARSVGLHIDPFVKAIQRHYPDWWVEYVRTHSSLPERVCQYCEKSFTPMSARQQYCDRYCGHDARTDKAYFSGNRKEAIGIAAGACQLCGVKKKRGLSVHHVFGKENDPGDKTLIALCPGCHQIVTSLGGRRFLDEPDKWEALISLAWLRKNGGLPEGKDLYVEVQIEVCDS